MWGNYYPNIVVQRLLEGEHHLGPQEGHQLVAGVVVAWEKEFAPEVPRHVTAEFILQDALEIVAAEGAGGGEGTITQAFQVVKITSGRGLVGKQRVVTGAEVQIFDRRYAQVGPTR